MKEYEIKKKTVEDKVLKSIKCDCCGAEIERNDCDKIFVEVANEFSHTFVYLDFCAKCTLKIFDLINTEPDRHKDKIQNFKKWHEID